MKTFPAPAVRLFLFAITTLTVAGADGDVVPADAQALVGYVNISVPVGTSLFASPLNDADEPSVLSLMAGAPDQTELVVRRDGASVTNRYSTSLGWDDPLMRLLPYEAFQITAPAPFEITFVGEVSNQTHPFARVLPAGESWSGLPLPTSLRPLDQLCFPAEEGVSISRLQTDGSRLPVATFTGNQWVPSVPALPNASGFIIQSPQPLYWSTVLVGTNTVCLNPGPARIRGLPKRIVAGPKEAVVLRPVVDGPRPMDVEWFHQGTGVIPVTSFSILLPTVGDLSQGTFTMNVTDADGHAASASTSVERYSGAPLLRLIHQAGTHWVDLYGRTTQPHRLLVSPDLKAWSPWTPPDGPLELPMLLDLDAAFGDRQSVFLRLEAD